MDAAKIACQNVARELSGPRMEQELIRYVQSTFRPTKYKTASGSENEQFGSRHLVSPIDHGGYFEPPVSVAHGEVLLSAHGNLRVPVIVIPVGATDRQLHRLSEAVQNYARIRAADRVGAQLGFVAIRRGEGVDVIKPALWAAEAVTFK